uniref:SKA complex subunit 1 homolog n=1 Tax=Kalanchoe fedtschenkoi TaxID=63787 RepID=A0A7N1A3Q1_KALFE
MSSFDEMDVKQAGTSLDALVRAFNLRISDLRELVIARNLYPGTCVTDLSAIDTSLTAMELQVQAIKDRLREEADAIPKAKKLIEASLKQQRKLQNMSSYVPSALSQRTAAMDSKPEESKLDVDFSHYKLHEDAAALPKEKKGRQSPPLRYITVEELDFVPTYMKGRLTLEKINAAITDMAAYAEANAHLLSASRKKMTETTWERALELRDIAMNEGLKGKHFFLENDIKGPSLKLDNTGKAILTVLRHLGRISETRIRHHRVIVLLKPQPG